METIIFAILVAIVGCSECQQLCQYLRTTNGTYNGIQIHRQWYSKGFIRSQYRMYSAGNDWEFAVAVDESTGSLSVVTGDGSRVNRTHRQFGPQLPVNLISGLVYYGYIYSYYCEVHRNLTVYISVHYIPRDVFIIAFMERVYY